MAVAWASMPREEAPLECHAQPVRPLDVSWPLPRCTPGICQRARAWSQPWSRAGWVVGGWDVKLVMARIFDHVKYRRVMVRTERMTFILICASPRGLCSDLDSCQVFLFQ